MIKRLCDIILGMLFFIVSVPIMIFASIGITVTNRGPLIYKARRIGKDGKVFTLYKFRTMKIESGEIRLTTLKNDERIYPFGALLRNTKIDELPQLVNVMLGQMSIVGPRPEDLKIAERIYTGKYKEIYSIKPGLTSPGSLFDYTHGEKYSTEQEYEQYFLPKKLEMELYYVFNRNLKYDIKIILKTVVIILKVTLGKTIFDYPKEYYLLNGYSLEEKNINF